MPDAYGHLTSQDKVKNGIFGVLDPGGLLVPQTKDTSRPAYEEALNAYNATGAINTGDLISKGYYTDANGKVQFGLPTGQSAVQLAGGAAVDQNGHIAAMTGSNPFQARQGLAAEAAMNGSLGRAIADKNGTTAALGAAGTAANGVGTAGLPSAAFAQGSMTRNQGQIGAAEQDMNVIRNSANGTGPSAAEQLAKAQLDNNIRAQSAMAASARGGNIAAAMRGATQAGSQQMLQTGQQIAAQRAQEQLNAQGMLTPGNAAIASGQNALTSSALTQRAQDISQAGQAATAQLGVANAYGNLTGTQSQMADTGIAAMGQAAGQYDQQLVAQQNAEAQARQQYMDYLQKQYSLQNGMPVNNMGYQTQMAQIAQQQQGATQGAIGGLLTKLI